MGTPFAYLERQLRHTFASLLLQRGAPHHLRLETAWPQGRGDYAARLRALAAQLAGGNLVDLLDDRPPAASQAHPGAVEQRSREALSRLFGVVSQEGIEPSTQILETAVGRALLVQVLDSPWLGHRTALLVSPRQSSAITPVRGHCGDTDSGYWTCHVPIPINAGTVKPRRRTRHIPAKHCR